MRHTLWYADRMTQLAIRLDKDSEESLDRLVTRLGRTRSDVVRLAIDALDRATLIERMKADAQLVRDDPADRAETNAVLADMSQRRAW